MARDVIVLNRMFSGSYLDENLGHEIINLFLCDNGNHYVYLTDDGTFDKAYLNRIKTVVFVQDDGNNAVKIIGKADVVDDIFAKEIYLNDVKLEGEQSQVAYILRNEVKYGGTYLHAIHFNDKQQSTWITFLCKNYCVPASGNATIQFSYTQSCTQGSITRLKANKARSSLKQYFKPCDADYATLDQLLNDPNAWEAGELKEVNVNVKPKPEHRRVMMEELFKYRIKDNKRMSDWFDITK